MDDSTCLLIANELFYCALLDPLMMKKLCFSNSCIEEQSFFLCKALKIQRFCFLSPEFFQKTQKNEMLVFVNDGY